MHIGGGRFDRIKQRLRPYLNHNQRRFLLNVAGACFSNNLPRLATIYDSDKWGSHWYAQHYQRHFADVRKKKVTLLEIGVGGYTIPTSGGASLRMWKRFFPRGLIYGLDIHDKSAHNEARIRTFRGDQTDEVFLRQVIEEIGHPDIVIDDGSHINSHVIKTLEILFPLLARNGVYVIEDTQTSYWPAYGGNSEQLDNVPTSMCFLKRLIDGLNYEELIRPGYAPSYFDKSIVSIHVYHNLAFIYKGKNDEGSTEVVNNMSPR